MKIELSTIDKDGKALPDDLLADELTIYFDRETAKGNARNLSIAAEAMGNKEDPDEWAVSFQVKGKMRIL